MMAFQLEKKAVSQDRWTCGLSISMSHQSLYKVHLLCFGERTDSVVKEHSEQLGAQPLLTSAATAACTGPHNRGLCQGQHSERWMDGENWSKNTDK